MADYSKFQQKVIKNYYDNQETILLQRLGEHITELYLADGKARAKRWKDITKVLEKLKVPASRIETLVQKDNPAMLAKLLEEFTGAHRTTCYRALRLNGRFAQHLRADGAMLCYRVNLATEHLGTNRLPVFAASAK